VFRLLAVDPGDTHCGLAKLEISQSGAADGQQQWRVRCVWSTETTPEMCVTIFEAGLALDELRPFVDGDLQPEVIDAYVVEEYRLYPWLAREQGYSEFKTVKLIGKLEYLAGKRGAPLYLQSATEKKRSIAIARDQGAELVRLASGRLDFPGKNQHARDAIAHGYLWAYRNPASPIVRSRQRNP